MSGRRSIVVPAGAEHLPVHDPATHRAVAGGLQAPLNAKQKRALVTAARAAYDHRGGARTGQSFEEFRHEQQLQACGVESLRDCRQHHYKLLRGHFDLLTGRPVDAFRKFVGAGNGDQERELVLAKIAHEAHAVSGSAGQKFGSPADALLYVDGFLQRKRGTTMEKADATQLWHGFFTLRRATAGLPRNRRARQGSGKTSQDSILEGGARGGDGRGAIRARPATRNPQTTANEFKESRPC